MALWERRETASEKEEDGLSIAAKTGDAAQSAVEDTRKRAGKSPWWGREIMTSPWGEIWMSGIGVFGVFFLFLFRARGLEDDDIGSCSWGFYRVEIVFVLLEGGGGVTLKIWDPQMS